MNKAVRTRYGEKFYILETPDELILLPIPEDPVAELARLGKKLQGYSVEEIKAAIQERAEEEALSGLRRH